MYTGALPARANRENLSLAITITDDAGAAVDLTGAVITVGIREPEARQPRKTWVSGSSAEL